MLRKFIFKIVHNYFSKYLYKRNSYSQDGEDVILLSFFENFKNYKGFYIDVGAHHPFRFSNTAIFYRKGWKGINIEPTPELYLSFLRYRKRDINLNFGIGNGEKLFFYKFNEPALNTFDKSLANERVIQNLGKYFIEEKIFISTYRLDSILDNYLPNNQKIDFITIDVEGLDFEVLKTNNWEKYKPNFILIESCNKLEDFKNDEIYKYLHNLEYQIVAKTNRTFIYKLSK